MEVLVLASGSSGNSVMVRSGDTSLLLDVGVSALQVRLRLEVFGMSPDVLGGIVLTHEHTDHVRGLDVMLKRHRLPVWATAGTWAGISSRSDLGGELISGKPLVVGGLKVTPVATSHDAREPVALVVDDGERRVGLCTDTGIFTALLEQRFEGCNLLLVETNHDVDLLRNGPYPWSLKQRIRSRLGHLSNEQCQEAVERLMWPSLRAVVGLHLSAENNSVDLVRDVLRSCTRDSVPVEAVPRTHMLRLVCDDGGLEMDLRSIPPSNRKRRVF